MTAKDPEQPSETQVPPTPEDMPLVAQKSLQQIGRETVEHTIAQTNQRMSDPNFRVRY